jgi:tetratricopeptide (TPR) repeat protein
MLSKIFGFLKKPKDRQKTEGNSPKFQQKINNLVNAVGSLFLRAQDEILLIREKSKNLRETNFKLGLMHLEKGNLPEAIFRFRFIKKFWPDLYDAYYQLAYCLVIKKRYAEAKQILEELFMKNPNYDQKARDLLAQVDSFILQQK